MEKPRILYCEDDAEMSDLVCMVLRSRFDADVVICSNGILGMDALKSGHFDIVISDFDMGEPKGNGIDLFQFMLRESINSPFYLFTANLDEQFLATMKLPNFIYVSKFKLNILLEEISKKLGKPL